MPLGIRLDAYIQPHVIDFEAVNGPLTRDYWTLMSNHYYPLQYSQENCKVDSFCTFRP